MKSLNGAGLTAFIIFVMATMSACNNGKPKPVSKDITKTTVAVDGKKDSVINNPEKNYGNATISEPCIKCLIGVVQKTDGYTNLTSAIPPKNIIYDANWITSSKPVDLYNNDKIVNGMMIVINSKDGGSTKTLATYLYNNENGRFYLQDDQTQHTNDIKIDSAAMKKIRASCFWGVASAK